MKVADVKINKNKKSFICDVDNIDIVKNQCVLIDVDNNLYFGTIVSEPRNIDDNLNSNIYKIKSIASEDDINQNNKNILDAKKALNKCRELVEKYDLNMYIIDAEYTHDRNQLYFRFMADNRVDFRNLAKDLANIYKTRIELRQIGVRDRAKDIGGYGQCGRPLCCSKFMNDFDSISINMAKTQNIALNPSKINGICGRLLCCLKYENECYKECCKGLPQMNKKIKTDQGEGKVIAVDVLKGTYKVNIPDVGIVEFEKEKDESK